MTAGVQVPAKGGQGGPGQETPLPLPVAVPWKLPAPFGWQKCKISLSDTQASPVAEMLLRSIDALLKLVVEASAVP